MNNLSLRKSATLSIVCFLIGIACLAFSSMRINSLNRQSGMQILMGMEYANRLASGNVYTWDMENIGDLTSEMGDTTDKLTFYKVFRISTGIIFGAGVLFFGFLAYKKEWENCTTILSINKIRKLGIISAIILFVIGGAIFGVNYYKYYDNVKGSKESLKELRQPTHDDPYWDNQKNLDSAIRNNEEFIADEWNNALPWLLFGGFIIIVSLATGIYTKRRYQIAWENVDQIDTESSTDTDSNL